MSDVHVHLHNNSDQKVTFLLDDERDAERIDQFRLDVRSGDLKSVDVKPAPKASAK